MTADALFWVGLATASGAGLLYSLLQLSKRRQELTTLQAELVAQSTSATLAGERTRELETELATLQQTLTDLNAQLSAQTATLSERDSHHQQQMKWVEESRSTLRAELEVIGQKLLSSSGKALETTNQKSLDSLLKPLAEKIDQFQTRVNQVHTDMVRNSASLSEQIKHLESVGVSMSGEAQNLTRALKGDKKLVGNWGEAQLEKTLELAGLRRGEHYDAQVAFKDEQGDRHLPDFVIRLPEGKNLIIDSKVSLVDYERAVTAENDAERAAALEAHAKAVRNHIDALSAKDYANLPGMESPDFVLMFMPVEPAYIEVMRSHRELFNHGYQKKCGVGLSHHADADSPNRRQFMDDRAQQPGGTRNQRTGRRHLQHGLPAGRAAVRTGVVNFNDRESLQRRSEGGSGKTRSTRKGLAVSVTVAASEQNFPGDAGPYRAGCGEHATRGLKRRRTGAAGNRVSGTQRTSP